MDDLSGEAAQAGNPLVTAAGIFAAADPLPARKRSAPLQGGRDVCFVHDCDCTTGLVGVPTARVADANFMLQHCMLIDLGTYAGKPRELPAREDRNKLCEKHRPKLPERQVIGARVMARLEGRVVPATIVGPAAGRAMRKAPATRELPASSRWSARPDDAGAAGGWCVDMTTDEVRQAAELRAAYDVSVSAAEAAAKKAYRGQVNRLQHALKYARDKGCGPQPPPGPPPPAGSPRRAAAGATSGSPRVGATAPSSQEVQVRARVPRTWQPGEAVAIELGDGHVPRSVAAKFMVTPPDDAAAGAFITVPLTVQLRPPPPPPPATVSKSGTKARDMREYIAARAEAARLVYSATPNPLNPARAWPVREQLSFANLRPE